MSPPRTARLMRFDCQGQTDCNCEPRHEEPREPPDREAPEGKLEGDGGGVGIPAGLPPIACRGAPTFVRGDCNGDGMTEGVSDAVFMLNHFFAGGPAPPCLAACDVNADGKVGGSVADAIFLLIYLFLGGAAPCSPFPECGAGTETDAETGCENPPKHCIGA